MKMIDIMHVEALVSYKDSMKKTIFLWIHYLYVTNFLKQNDDLKVESLKI